MSERTYKTTIEVEPEISVLGIKIKLKGVFELLTRVIRRYSGVTFDILVIGPPKSGKTWFIRSEQGWSREELEGGISPTIGIEDKNYVISLDGEIKNAAQVRSHDVGGQEFAWLQEGLQSTQGALAILLFVHHEKDNDAMKETKQYIRRLAIELGKRENDTLKNNIRILIPIVSKADLWMAELEHQGRYPLSKARREFITEVQERYRNDYDMLIKQLGVTTGRYSPTFVATSALNNEGKREIARLLFDNIIRG